MADWNSFSCVCSVTVLRSPFKNGIHGLLDSFVFPNSRSRDCFGVCRRLFAPPLPPQEKRDISTNNTNLDLAKLNYISAVNLSLRLGNAKFKTGNAKIKHQQVQVQPRQTHTHTHTHQRLQMTVGTVREAMKVGKTLPSTANTAQTPP